jgi:hypothetical protein
MTVRFRAASTVWAKYPPPPLLTEHGHHGGLGWFLDALGFTTLNPACPIGSSRQNTPQVATDVMLQVGGNGGE